MMRKASFRGGKALIRLLVGTPEVAAAYPLLLQQAGTFGAFSLGEGKPIQFSPPLVLAEQIVKPD